MRTILILQKLHEYQYRNKHEIFEYFFRVYVLLNVSIFFYQLEVYF